MLSKIARFWGVDAEKPAILIAHFSNNYQYNQIELKFFRAD
jgi:hypothetical protein